MSEVHYSVGCDGEIMRHGPNGNISYMNTLQAARRMIDDDIAGHTVFIEEERVFPETGFWAWANRTIEWLIAKVKQ